MRHPEPLDLDALTLCDVHEIPHFVSVRSLARPQGDRSKPLRVLDLFPDIMAGLDLKQVVRAVVAGRKKGKPIMIAIGGHVIKCGLGPVVAGLVRDGFISAVALNGAAAIHDLELAWFGETSEDVETGLRSGRFGIARQTGRRINGAVAAGVRRGRGLAEAIMAELAHSKPQFVGCSVIQACRESGALLTIHPALGTDTIHSHPGCDWSLWALGAYRDFEAFAGAVADLNDGGVYLNVGSAVMLPEVFLKALNAARNIRPPVENFTTVSLDMLHPYRSIANVAQRPNGGNQGYVLQGRHEIMLPILAAALYQEWEENEE